jgi:hypothetical protein
MPSHPMAPMLAPAAVLVLWSMAVMLWMARSRFAAMANTGIDVTKSPPGGRGQNLEGRLPATVNWKSHNYTHLMEQPTIFYPAVIILAVMGAGVWDVRLAWAYTLLRIVHSLWQGLVNTIPVRAGLFFASSSVLIVLAVRAVRVTLLAA